MFLALLLLTTAADVPPVVAIPPVVAVPPVLVGPDARPVTSAPRPMPAAPPGVTYEYRQVCYGGVCRWVLVPVIRER